MNQEHVISDEAFSNIQKELSVNGRWIAYNTIPHFLSKLDMHFFKDKDSAEHTGAVKRTQE